MTSGESGASSARGASPTSDDGSALPVPRHSRSLARPAHRPSRSVRDWPVWTLPPRVLAFVLAVDVLAVVAGLAAALTRAPDLRDLSTVAILALGAMAHLEAARHIERIRNQGRSDDGVPYIDAKSMWSFAALVLVPPGLALALVVFTLVWWRVRVSQRPPLYRWVFSGATIMVGTVAAAAVLAIAGPDPVDRVADGPGVVVVLVLAALVRWTVNHGLVVAVIGLTSPATPWRERVGSATDNLIGLGALALGIALAVLVDATPWLVPVLLVPVLAMHRGVLLGHFARAARTDPKTGLATIGHWRDRAVRELTRTRRRGGRLGVLMIDLDEFKAVNDRHGHLVGDRVLGAVADALRAEVPVEESVGRFGGEEFIVLVLGSTPQELVHAGDRVRRRIAACEVVVETADGAPRRTVVSGLTASVGAASWPLAAQDIDSLVVAADAALYAAKRDGRDRVRTADLPRS